MTKIIEVAFWMAGASLGVWAGGGSAERMYFIAAGVLVGVTCAYYSWVKKW